VAQFLIGRDPQCHLRPASQAVSKRHCGLLIRDGRVVVKDFGSTNGTVVNGELITAAETEVQDGASLQIGPLDFTVVIERPAPQSDATPPPGKESPALAALKAVTAAGSKTATPRDATPNPARPAKPAGTSSGSQETPALRVPATKTPPVPAPPSESDEDENDRVAAMLLEMDDNGGGVPEGSTVMEMPAFLSGGEQKPTPPKPGEEKKKLAQTREEMSNAANDILRKMMRRPK